MQRIKDCLPRRYRSRDSGRDNTCGPGSTCGNGSCGPGRDSSAGDTGT
ncbi:MAG: hypothetical protein ACLUAR_06450 [Pilosibacter sp.]